MRLAVLIGCAGLGACLPPVSSSDYSVPFARSYWAAPPGGRPALSTLTVEQLYALNQYGRRAFHPWRTLAPEFACRGSEAILYLKSKITPKTVGSILEVLAWMRRMNTYEPFRDADLIARVQAAFALLPKSLRTAYSPELSEIDPSTLASPHPYYAPGQAVRLRVQYCGAPPAALNNGQSVH